MREVEFGEDIHFFIDGNLCVGRVTSIEVDYGISGLPNVNVVLAGVMLEPSQGMAEERAAMCRFTRVTNGPGLKIQGPDNAL
jgi:hypothetical protein